jgi:general secretion pathway protein M
MNSAQRLRNRAQAFWRGLAPREKHLLIGAGLVLASLLTWLVLVQPALKRSLLAGRNPVRAQAAALQVLLQGVGAPRPPTAGLRQALDDAGLQGHYQCRRWMPVPGA